MDTAAELLVGEQSEPPLHLVEPRRVGGREVHVEPGVGSQPLHDRRRLVGAVVVADQMDLQAGGDLHMSSLARNFLNSVARWGR
jgi:hypothetical protein